MPRKKMRESGNPSKRKWQASATKAIIGFGEDIHNRLHKFRHNLFVFSVLVALLSALALLNAYFRFANISSYDINQEGLSPFLIAGYLGMFITVAFLPIPDYFLIPAYGFLSSLGVFDPYVTFLVCLIAAILPYEYAVGRLAGRPLLLKGLSYFGISEKTLESAEKWLVEHGKFSIFISTFIPFFYTVTSIAAGVLKMSPAKFLLASAEGFGLRYAFLEYIGYSSVFVFTASFDYSQRVIIALLLIVSSICVALYLLGNFRSSRPDSAT
jgi:membrane protein DedA with SNARE-associated domain